MGRHRAKTTTRFWFGFAFIGVGLLLLGYSLWTPLIGDPISANEKQTDAIAYSASPVEKENSLVRPELAEPGDVFARIVVPRLGEKFVRLIGEGTMWHPVLNEIGVGHYFGTAFPAEIGNFATAAHRGGFGGTYRNIHQIVEGDKAYVQTIDGWYIYTYRQTKIVKPTEVGVIAAVPEGLNGAREGGRYLTMTSCDPVFVNTDRIIVWFELEEFSPANQPAPKAVRWLETK